jgi:voltage-gated potassium channel
MIVIFGYSKLAAQIAELFHTQGYYIVVSEPIKQLKEFAQKDHYVNEVYGYECYDDNELFKLGIGSNKIQTFFCLHNEVNNNLFVTLSARNIDKNLQIISLAHNHNESTKLKLAGASTTINPYETAALKAFRQIHRPRVLKILNDILYSESDLVIQEIQIPPNSNLDGKYFSELTIFDEYNLILLGIQDTELSNKFIFASRGINHKIDAGDVLVVLGNIQDLFQFQEAIKS